MIRTFVGREDKLDFLEKEFAQNRKSFIVVFHIPKVSMKAVIFRSSMFSFLWL